MVSERRLERVAGTLGGPDPETLDVPRGVATPYCMLRGYIESRIRGGPPSNRTVIGEGMETRWVPWYEKGEGSRKPTELEGIIATMNDAAEAHSPEAMRQALDAIIAEKEAGLDVPWGINARQHVG